MVELRRGDYVHANRATYPDGDTPPGATAIADFRYIVLPASQIDAPFSRTPSVHPAPSHVGSYHAAHTHIRDFGKCKNVFRISGKVIDDFATKKADILDYIVEYWPHYGNTSLVFGDRKSTSESAANAIVGETDASLQGILGEVISAKLSESVKNKTAVDFSIDFAVGKVV